MLSLLCLGRPFISSHCSCSFQQMGMEVQCQALYSRCLPGQDVGHDGAPVGTAHTGCSSLYAKTLYIA